MLARFSSEVVALVSDAFTEATRRSTPVEAKRRPRRAPAELEALSEAIVRTLKQGGPRSIGELARGIGASPRELVHPLGRLLKAGQVIQAGTRRGARYAVPPAGDPVRSSKAPDRRTKTRRATGENRARR